MIISRPPINVVHQRPMPPPRRPGRRPAAAKSRYPPETPPSRHPRNRPPSGTPSSSSPAAPFPATSYSASSARRRSSRPGHHLQLALAAVELEGKHVLPFRAAGMQESHLLLGRLQQEEGIVVDRHIPEESVGRAVDFGDVTQEPARQIDQMNPLIDQLAAARDCRVRPPLLVVADRPPWP